MTGDPTTEERSAEWAEAAVREAEAEDAAGSGAAPGLSREQEVLARIDRARARKARIKEARITLAHGAGGKATHTLIDAVFLEAFANPLLEPLEDQAVFSIDGGARLAFTTASLMIDETPDWSLIYRNVDNHAG